MYIYIYIEREMYIYITPIYIPIYIWVYSHLSAATFSSPNAATVRIEDSASLAMAPVVDRGG